MLPKIKKNIQSFLTSEEGKITKQSLFTMGAFASSAILSGLLTMKEVKADSHNNSLTPTADQINDIYTTTHTHHGSHGSHSNHGNHSSG